MSRPYGHTGSHASRTSMDTTVDSGYASSSSYFAPHPEWQLSRTYENWKIADAATQRLFVDLRAKERCEEMLRAARKRRDQAQRRCVSISLSPHGGRWAGGSGPRVVDLPFILMTWVPRTGSPKTKRKPSLLNIPFGRRKTVDGALSTSPPSSSTDVPPPETVPGVAELEEQLEALNKRVRTAYASSVPTSTWASVHSDLFGPIDRCDRASRRAARHAFRGAEEGARRRQAYLVGELHVSVS